MLRGLQGWALVALSLLMASSALAQDEEPVAPEEEPGEEIPEGELEPDPDAPDEGPGEEIPEDELEPEAEPEQEPDVIEESELGNPEVGGFGFFSPGLFFADFGLLAKDLARSDSLGVNSAPSPLGLSIGGGGRALYGRWIVGGKGFGVFSSTGVNATGESFIAGGGGGFDVGFTLLNEDYWLIYPFFGLGGVGFNMEVKNTSAAPIRFGTSETINPGQTGTFNTGFFTFEAGAGAQHLLHEGEGGFQIGIEGGLLAAIGQSSWFNANGDVVEGSNKVKLDGFYLRLTIGGGGFFLGEPEPDDEADEAEGDKKDDKG